MTYKKTTAEVTTVTRDITRLDDHTGNLYETLTVISRRANQVQGKMKEELQHKLEEFASHTDNLEEVFENREQIEISRYYERLPKPTAIAYQEWLDDQIYFRKPEEEKAE
jgi:DNA-directed RNA polymerase subunit K/omega